MTTLAPVERIAEKILVIRGERVMLDSDLAPLYRVETKALNRAVKRNRERFPQDFMFQLTAEEFEALRFQTGTSNLRSQSGTSPSGKHGRLFKTLMRAYLPGWEPFTNGVKCARV